MTDPRNRLVALTAGILLAALPAGCGTDPAPAPPTGEVVDMRHNPDEVWYGGGVALRGTWELRICPAPSECVWRHVSEETYAETEVGDRVEITESAITTARPTDGSPT